MYESNFSIYLPSNVKFATSLHIWDPSLNTITLVLKMLRLICHRWQYISSLCVKRCNPILVSDISTRSSAKSKWFIKVPPIQLPPCCRRGVDTYHQYTVWKMLDWWHHLGEHHICCQTFHWFPYSTLLYFEPFLDKSCTIFKNLPL